MDYWQRIRQAVGKETLILPGAAGAIIQDGKILLVRHNLLKKWQIPGGVQEIGEAIQQTVEREIQEELGLELRAGALIGVYSHPKWAIELPDGSKIQKLTFFFAMEIGQHARANPLPKRGLPGRRAARRFTQGGRLLMFSARRSYTYKWRCNL